MSPAARQSLLLGFRNAMATPAWIVGLSFLGVGSLARDAGHPIGAAVLSTVLIWAAPAQLILYGSLSQNGLVVAAAIGVALSGIRLLPMTLAIWPYLKRPGQSLIRQAVIAHFVAATTWVEALRRLPDMEEEARLPYFFGFGLACMSLSAVMTGIGYMLVGALPGALAAGLLCLTPIYFTISLVAGARAPGDWLAIGLGLGLAPIAQRIAGSDFDLLLTGLVGGTAAYAAQRWHDRRRAG